MKSTYVVTLKVANREVLADIIDAVEGKATSIEIATATSNETSVKPRAPFSAPSRSPTARRERRTKRRSKVNDAIIGAMDGGRRASLKDLKTALETAGMSASSLSTGIAALTKAGQIERVGDGEYALKAA